MNHNQQELRDAANKAFMDSLEQLEATLGYSQDTPPRPAAAVPSKPQPQSSSAAVPINLADLEEAAADIEQYMNYRYGHSESDKIE